MAQGVIDFLETVEVQIHQGKGGMIAFQLAQRLQRKSPGPGAGKIVKVGIAAQIVQPLVGLHQRCRQTVIAVFHMEFPQNLRQTDEIAADIHQGDQVAAQQHRHMGVHREAELGQYRLHKQIDHRQIEKPVEVAEIPLLLRFNPELHPALADQGRALDARRHQHGQRRAGAQHNAPVHHHIVVPPEQNQGHQPQHGHMDAAENGEPRPDRIVEHMLRRWYRPFLDRTQQEKQQIENRQADGRHQHGQRRYKGRQRIAQPRTPGQGLQTVFPPDQQTDVALRHHCNHHQRHQCQVHSRSPPLLSAYPWFFVSAIIPMRSISCQERVKKPLPYIDRGFEYANLTGQRLFLLLG